MDVTVIGVLICLWLRRFGKFNISLCLYIYLFIWPCELLTWFCCQILGIEKIPRFSHSMVLEGGSIHVDGEGKSYMQCFFAMSKGHFSSLGKYLNGQNFDVVPWMPMVLFSNKNWSFTLIICIVKVCNKDQCRLPRWKFNFDLRTKPTTLKELHVSFILFEEFFYIKQNLTGCYMLVIWHVVICK